MPGFMGGSAWAMARDISEGYILVTQRTFARMRRPEMDLLSTELEKCLRKVRGEQPPLDDTQALQVRNRKITRLTGAQRILNSARFGRRGMAP